MCLQCLNSVFGVNPLGISSLLVLHERDNKGHVAVSLSYSSDFYCLQNEKLNTLFMIILSVQLDCLNIRVVFKKPGLVVILFFLFFSEPWFYM